MVKAPKTFQLISTEAVFYRDGNMVPNGCRGHWDCVPIRMMCDYRNDVCLFQDEGQSLICGLCIVRLYVWEMSSCPATLAVLCCLGYQKVLEDGGNKIVHL